MTEKYDLPIKFTEEERKAYAAWGIKKEKVMAINWGFVAGKTNTIFAWDEKMPDKIEPPLWFHDILRQDASPFDPEEVKTIKRLNAK